MTKKASAPMYRPVELGSSVEGAGGNVTYAVLGDATETIDVLMGREPPFALCATMFAACMIANALNEYLAD